MNSTRPFIVGIPFTYQEDWLGGLYYPRNVVSALAMLPAEQRPRLVVIGDARGCEYLRAETGYSDLPYVLPRCARLVRHRNLNPFRRPPAASAMEIDVVLLGSSPGLEARSIQWIPDFQEERYPEFFSANELNARRRRNAKWLRRHRHVMVSSEDVRTDLARYYGAYHNRVHVVPFASFVERELEGVNIPELREKYKLPERYFICTNQFWRHKNHGMILRALTEMAEAERLTPVVMTGREHDYRDPAYAPSMRALVEELGIGERVRFLGMLPRADQLGLTSGAIAVIQPSLCEGWSTVVEDAKAMGKHVLASDIAVHREQLDRNVDFFSPDDARHLAELMARYSEGDPAVRPVDYEAQKRRFAERLIHMISEVTTDFRERRVARLIISPADAPDAPTRRNG